ncbi:hypothetical protein F3Y22_tig00112399pilonHSYRG00088 [Hibiscus syriacus]|uniref:Glycosyl transferase family 1 domain-containing protein n=1 Tax=Hibiscus syriacus TaxID=106335 RepID=A0A6A2WZG2_HIBSY|nr:hypothetical protein F3Y22_tig00112399pilonHSYRG00088 [Hibiscus syriacus]
MDNSRGYLAKRIPVYEKTGLEHLVSNWKSAFTRANVIVFPDFTLVMLYSLDTGNFLVIPGSPVDVWGEENYSMTHSKPQLREDNGFSMDDMVVVVLEDLQKALLGILALRCQWSLLMADIVLYGSSQEEQGFPPLIIRAMTFGIPVITPDFPIMKKFASSGRLLAKNILASECVTGYASLLENLLNSHQMSRFQLLFLNFSRDHGNGTFSGRK